MLAKRIGACLNNGIIKKNHFIKFNYDANGLYICGVEWWHLRCRPRN